MNQRVVVGAIVAVVVAILVIAGVPYMLGSRDLIIDDLPPSSSIGWEQFMGDSSNSGARGVSSGGTGEVVWEARIGPLDQSPAMVSDAPRLWMDGPAGTYLEHANVVLTVSGERLAMVGAGDGRILRTVDVGDPITSSPVASTRVATVGTANGTLVWISLIDQRTLEVATHAPIHSTPTFVLDDAVFANEEGTVFMYHLGPSKANLVWKTPLNGSIIAPVLTGGLGPVVVTHDGEVVTIGSADGEIAWRATIGSTVSHSAVFAGSHIFVATDSGVAHALDPLTGEPRWTRQLGRSVTSDPTYVALRTDGSLGNIYVGTDTGELLALDANDGSVRWTFGSDGPIRSAAAIARSPGTDPEVPRLHVFFGSDDGHVYALNAETGELRWKHDTGAPVRSSPIVVDGILYVGTQTGLLALDAGHLDDASATAAGDDAVRPAPGLASVVVVLAMLAMARLEL